MLKLTQTWRYTLLAVLALGVWSIAAGANRASAGKECANSTCWGSQQCQFSPFSTCSLSAEPPIECRTVAC